MTATKMFSLVGLVLMQAVAEQTLRPLFDFAGPEAAQQWQAVNDGVMGGVSDGRFRVTPENTLEFFGTLSPLDETAQTLSSVAFLLPPASSRVSLTRRHDHETADIIHADDRYKVLKDRERIRVPRSTGKTLPVEFGTKEAAEGHVRAYQIMTRVRRWSRA